jgi:hypothetical protein
MATSILVSKNSSMKINAIFYLLIVQRVKIPASAFKYVKSFNVITIFTSVTDALRLESLYRNSFGATPAVNFVAVMNCFPRTI